MKVTVVGGSGFIGSWLVPELLGNGHEVEVFDLVERKDLGVPVRVGDIRDPEALSGSLRGVDAVVHLAAEHRDDVQPQRLYWDVNVEGTANLIRAAEAEGVGRIVFTSTVAVYRGGGGPAHEGVPPDPQNPYGRSKLEAEGLLQSWVEASPERRLTIVRPTVVFGEGNHGNVRTLIEQLRARRFVLVGDGTNRKSMCYVGNLVPFLARSLTLKEGPRVVNYVDPPDLTMGELVTIIRQELGRRGPPRARIPYWAGLAGGYAFDLMTQVSRRRFPLSSDRVRKFCAETRFEARALEELGHVRPYTLEEGLQRMVRNLAPVDAPRRVEGSALQRSH